MAKKIFVLDTNVLISDPKAIFNFDEPIKRNISFVVSKKADMVETACGMDISNFDLYVLFIYKKVC